jgi:steroid 5-alpha reductase family enzyme
VAGITTLPVLLAAVLGFMVAVMAAAWLTQKLTRNTGWVDVFWTFGAGLSGAAAALWPLEGDDTVMPARRWLVAVLIGLWALRLGTYIAARVMGSLEDARYVSLKTKWGKAFQPMLFGFVLLQAPVTVVFALATACAARAPRFEIGVQDILGVLVWLIAVGGETIADNQMKRFKADPRNRGKICNTGLWRWSRHPNYFFEWLGWFAYPIIAIAPDDPWTYVTLGAPVVMFLILRFITGVPPLEAAMRESRGKAFDDYAARTSTFLLLPPRRPVPAKETKKP